jgi:hypothetical protein
MSIICYETLQICERQDFEFDMDVPCQSLLEIFKERCRIDMFLYLSGLERIPLDISLLLYRDVGVL